MARLALVVFLGLCALGANAQLGEGPLADKPPIAKLMFLRNLLGGGGGDGNPLMKMMMMKNLFGEDGGDFDGIGGGEGPLADKPPIAKLMLMRNLLGGGGAGGDGPLSERPLLRMMMMKRMFGGEGDGPLGGDGPLARAMGSDNTPNPLLRAMFMRRLAQGGGGDGGPFGGGEDNQSVMRHLMMFRVMGQQMGEKIIERAVDLNKENRVWSFASTLSCDCALEYIDDEGKMAGFTFDLVEKVCETAGKKCVTLFDDSSNCYTHHAGEHPRTGKGLLARNYDICMNWIDTKIRQHSVSFTKPYWMEGSESHFYVKLDNPHGFDPHNLAGSSIGFVDGWASDPACLRQQATDVQLEAVEGDRPQIVYGNKDSLIEDLKADKIEAVFVLDSLVGQASELGFEQIGAAVNCGSGHSHGMARKDSHAVAWFDEALEKMVNTGTYYKLCRDARTKHGHKGEIKCVAPQDV